MGPISISIYKDFIKNYSKESDIVYFLEVAVQYPEELQEGNNDSPFLTERTKIGKVEKLLSNL